MVKSDGHIDMVFRDGLKNLEVLPPADVWDKIAPKISTGQGKGWVFRIAAGVAAMVSLGLLAYFVGMKSSDSLLGSVNAEAQQSITDNDFVTSDQANSVALAQATLLQQNNEPRVLSMHQIDEVASLPTTESSHLPSLFETMSNSSDFGVREVSKSDVIRSADELPVTAILESGSDQTNQLANVNQDNTDLNRRRWMLGAKVSPTYLSTNLKASNNNLSSSDAESAVLSYTGGLSVSYAVGERLSVQTGLYYSSLGRQISDINSYTGYGTYSDSKGGKIFGVATTSGVIASTNSDVFLADGNSNRISSISSAQTFDPNKANLPLLGSSLRQNFEYLEVPIMLSYRVIDKRIGFNIMGGMSYNFLLGNTAYAISDESKIAIGSTEDLNAILLSSALGMSMEYSLNDKFSLNLEPTFRYYLNSDGSLSANNPFTFGLFSGLYYKF